MYPILERFSNDEGMVRSFKAEHGDILGATSSMLTDLVRVTEDPDKELNSDFEKKVRKFQLGLSEHISREEKILFWLAELRLTGSDRRKLSLAARSVS